MYMQGVKSMAFKRGDDKPPRKLRLKQYYFIFRHSGEIPPCEPLKKLLFFPKTQVTRNCTVILTLQTSVQIGHILLDPVWTATKVLIENFTFALWKAYHKIKGKTLTTTLLLAFPPEELLQPPPTCQRRTSPEPPLPP